jgi:hypothetical protein
MAFTQRQQLKLEIVKLCRLLEEHILLKLNEYGDYRDTFLAGIEVWKDIRKKHPDMKWITPSIRQEREDHPLTKYVKTIEDSRPLPDLPPEILKLSTEELCEYLIWKSDYNQGVKEWKKYGRQSTKKEDPPKSDIKKQAPPPRGTRAYVPGGKTPSRIGVSPKICEEGNKGREKKAA